MRKTLEAIGIIALAVLFWITYSALRGPDRLPDRIPTHFDLAGNPNAWGTPATLLFVPGLALALYLAITVVSQFPSAFNFPVRVTPQNRSRLEKLAVSMVTWLKVELVCLFVWIQAATINSARHQALGLSPLLLPVSLVAVFGTIAWHFVAMRRAAKPH
ncbi:MAG: DUF1648 domain-containing protein [Terracidiphilus sp.]|jgi:uncharacterized membrane protein